MQQSIKPREQGVQKQKESCKCEIFWLIFCIQFRQITDLLYIFIYLFQTEFINQSWCYFLPPFTISHSLSSDSYDESFSPSVFDSYSITLRLFFFLVVLRFFLARWLSSFDSLVLFLIWISFYLAYCAASRLFSAIFMLHSRHIPPWP